MQMLKEVKIELTNRCSRNCKHCSSNATSSIGNLLKKFSLSKFLSGANKTLNVINQAIPIYYQVKPMISNAKTMFKVVNAIKTPDAKTNKINSNNYNSKKNNNLQTVDNSLDGNPTFFL